MKSDARPLWTIAIDFRLLALGFYKTLWYVAVHVPALKPQAGDRSNVQSSFKARFKTLISYQQAYQLLIATPSFHRRHSEIEKDGGQHTMTEQTSFSFRHGGFVTVMLCLAFSTRAIVGAEPTGRAAEDVGEQPTFVTVTRQDGLCVVKPGETEKVLFRSQDPRQAIEWALRHSRTAILTDGEFSVRDGVRIPRSGVTLIIAEDATLQAAVGAQLTAVSEGHGDYRPLIHNQGMDKVAVINFGTLRASIRGGTCIMFNGRSNGELGINGGLVFSTGTLAQCGDAIWLVDSKNLQIPFAGAKSYDNNLMAIEGCEDLQIDVVAGLAGSKAGENETIDLNSYSRRITIRRMIGTSPSEQVLDVNNSTDIRVDEIVGYTGDEKFRESLVDVITYGPQGRRLTQRPRIPKSENVDIRKKHVAEQRIREWQIVAEVEGLPETLPVIRATVRLIGNPQTTPVTVLQRTYQLRLGDTPAATVVE